MLMGGLTGIDLVDHSDYQPVGGLPYDKVDNQQEVVAVWRETTLSIGGDVDLGRG